LSRRDSRDLARVLARKAEGDAKAMRRLASDPEIDDAAVGFHAQQAIEKWMKAVIAFHGERFDKKHDLGLLLDVEPLDRDATQALVGEVGEWAATFVREE
jgi:HEPN domain-containing protein